MIEQMFLAIGIATSIAFFFIACVAFRAITRANKTEKEIREVYIVNPAEGSIEESVQVIEKKEIEQIQTVPNEPEEKVELAQEQASVVVVPEPEPAVEEQKKPQGVPLRKPTEDTEQSSQLPSIEEELERLKRQMTF